ncbi:hypothetical protein ACU686_23855 [Yinghuangia aomiensis]
MMRRRSGAIVPARLDPSANSGNAEPTLRAGSPGAVSPLTQDRGQELGRCNASRSRGRTRRDRRRARSPTCPKDLVAGRVARPPPLGRVGTPRRWPGVIPLPAAGPTALAFVTGRMSRGVGRRPGAAP